MLVADLPSVLVPPASEPAPSQRSSDLPQGRAPEESIPLQEEQKHVGAYWSISTYHVMRDRFPWLRGSPTPARLPGPTT